MTAASYRHSWAALSISSGTCSAPTRFKAAARNIKEHYDLSNAFFATFLDQTMTYSCARFLSREETLEQAQSNKLRSIIEKGGISAD